MPFLDTSNSALSANRAAAQVALRSLTLAWTDRPIRRSQDVLWDFTRGNATGWAFRVGSWFRNALDIRYTPRMENGRVLYEWTQGSAFNFLVGYTTTSIGWELELGGRSAPATVQVLESRPAAPATSSVYRWVRKPTETETGSIIAEAEEGGCQCEMRYEAGHKEPHALYVMTPRNIGVVRLHVLINSVAGWNVAGQLVMSQDDFVEVLIRGFDITHCMALAEAGREHGLGL